MNRLSGRRLALVQPAERSVRRDRLGRRIGRNWWREYNCEMLLDATLTWERQCENVTFGYATEMLEYAAEHPRPTLKALLLANKGINTEPDRTEIEEVA